VGELQYFPTPFRVLLKKHRIFLKKVNHGKKKQTCKKNKIKQNKNISTTKIKGVGKVTGLSPSFLEYC